MDGSISNYTFTYIDGSGSPPTFVVPSANCSGGVCQHMFRTPNSSVPPSYTVSVMATNVVGEGPATSSQLIREQILSTEMLLGNSIRELLESYMLGRDRLRLQKEGGVYLWDTIVLLQMEKYIASTTTFYVLIS